MSHQEMDIERWTDMIERRKRDKCKTQLNVNIEEELSSADVAVQENYILSNANPVGR